jgi:hypothetical protein
MLAAEGLSDEVSLSEELSDEESGGGGSGGAGGAGRGGGPQPRGKVAKCSGRKLPSTKAITRPWAKGGGDDPYLAGWYIAVQ